MKITNIEIELENDGTCDKVNAVLDNRSVVTVKSYITDDVVDISINQMKQIIAQYDKHFGDQL